MNIITPLEDQIIWEINMQMYSVEYVITTATSRLIQLKQMLFRGLPCYILSDITYM